MKEKAAGKVEEWKNALIEAASISGWDSQTYNGTEAEFVEDIAKDILAKLNEMYSSSNEFKGLVGINKNIEEMKQLLRIDDSTTVRMIGIWGMGGLGKTTLARVLFKQLSSEFEGCCFLANVREESGKCFPRGLQYLPESLKCLIINYCPWKSLPSHFMAPNLVELRMPRSNLVQLWSEVPVCLNLTIFFYRICGSIDLTEISALSQAPNLVSVDLSFCASLHQVPPLRFRIGDKLTSSDQSHNNCYYDECRTLGHLKLDHCIRLKVVEKISGNLIELHLSNSTSIEELSSSICSLYDLVYLNLSRCRRLKRLPSDIQILKSLKRLNLNGCSSFDTLPVLPRSLIELDLTGTSIEEVPSSSIEHLFSLEKLMLYDCKRLKSLPTGIKLKSLKELELKHCINLKIFPAILEPMEHLQTLDFRQTGIRVLTSLANLPILMSLDLSSCKISEIPNDVGCLSSIVRLSLCSTLVEELPFSICTLHDLEYLNLCDCDRLKSLPSDMQMLKSLTRLDLNGCSSFGKLPVLPRSLIELDLTATPIEEVPSSSIEHLFGLEKLTLHDCEILTSLPSDMQMLKSLTR
ncbi:hypothetical protein TIFTF001_033330, partial [Ficus carica]